MFKSRTVFVVGAGASRDFGLPIGSGLAAQISACLDLKTDRWGNITEGEHDIYEACRIAAQAHQGQPREYLRACRAISDALPTAVSIDTYLEVHEGDPEIEACGKLGILHSILKAERQSHLRASGDDDNAPPLMTNGPAAESWLSAFVRMVQTGIAKKNVEGALDNITFVIFNYDRCIEHYLYHWFQRYYRIDSNLAKQILAGGRFYHPYGVAGELPWQSSSGGGVPFGAKLDAHSLLGASSRIRTYSEQVVDSTTQSAIHAAIVDAQRLIYLGFGFGEQNMKFLTVPKQTNLRRVYGTAFDVSGPNQQEFEMRIANSLLDGSLEVILQGSTSAKMLSDYETVFVK